MQLDPIKSRLPSKFQPYWLLVKIALITYPLIYLVSELTLKYIIPVGEIQSGPIEGQSAVHFLIAFLFFATPIIYLANSWIAGKLLKIEWSSAIFNIGLAMFLGTSLEIIVNLLFENSIGRPSWVYHIWPKYGGYTSGITSVMWPMYGFHLYCFHKAMSLRNSPVIKNVATKGIMMAIDAMIMETIANLFALIAFQSYYFYYLFGDLNHFTTIEIFLPYILVGFLVMGVLHFLDRPKYPRILLGILLLIMGWTILIFG